METLKPRNTLKVTINPDVDTDLILSGWPVNTQTEIFDKEPERFTVEKGNRSISIVLTSDGPVLEVWEIDDAGEPGGLLSTMKIPV